MAEIEPGATIEPGRLSSTELKALFLQNCQLVAGDLPIVDEEQLDFLIAREIYAGVRLPNGSVIIFVNEPDENKEERNEPTPLAKALAFSPLTTAVALEYSHQDLTQSISRSHVARRFQQAAIDRTWEVNSKARYFTRIEQLCQAHGKQIMAIDIANKALFEVYEGAAVAAIFGEFAAFYLLLLIDPTLSPLAFTLTPLQLQGIEILLGQYLGTSIYDRSQIHGYEKFVLEIEDARRVFAALNLWRTQQALPAQVKNPQEGESPAQIVAYSQKAHGMRWARYVEMMIERHKQGIPVDQKDWSTLGLRLALYKMYVGLDFDARYYPPLSGGDKE